jgi:AcrR family transcriptional regulator
MNRFSTKEMPDPSSEEGDLSGQASTTDQGKAPRTSRGRRTLRAILDAATAEFGEKGFHDASIAGIMARAGLAIGSFYTYFDSKEALFTALVRDLSEQVRDYVAPHIAGAASQIEAERAGQRSYLEFARLHKEVYRIIDEAEFVHPATYREHYSTTAVRIAARLDSAVARGEISPGSSEIRAWALMGINVFLGLRFAVWDNDVSPDEVARVGGDLIAHGLLPPGTSEPGD